MAKHHGKGGRTLAGNLAEGIAGKDDGSRIDDLARFLRAHPVKIRRLARACGGCCEHCGFSYPISHLSVYILDPEDNRLSSESDLQNSLLVLCPACMSFFATEGVSREQIRVLIHLRQKEASQAMRKILMTRSRSYSPPQSPDWAALSVEIMTGGAPDLCLNGG
jgi:hypothetical protein